MAKCLNKSGHLSGLWLSCRLTFILLKHGRKRDLKEASKMARFQKGLKERRYKDMSWYRLNVPAAPTNPSSYSEIPSPSGCTGNNQICVIQASEGDPGRPDLTEDLLAEMLTAVASHTDSTNVRLKA